MTTMPHSPTDSHPPTDPVPVRTYYYIFAALLALLFLTVGLAFLPAKGAWRDLLTAIGFLIAGAKALLIILWFMHVKQGPRLTLVFALAAFFWLVIMFSLGMSDYRTRPGTANAGKPEPRVPASVAADEYRPDGSTGRNYKR